MYTLYTKIVAEI